METLVLGPEVDLEAQVVVPRFIESGKPSDPIWSLLFSDKSFSGVTGSASAASGIGESKHTRLRSTRYGRL